MTFELMSSNLASEIESIPLSISKIRKVGVQLLSALAFLWNKDIIHADLKPENILLAAPRGGVAVVVLLLVLPLLLPLLVMLLCMREE